MSAHALISGFLQYLFLVVLLTFHEWAHAWTAWKRGDDTARVLGRVSLNPAVHMDKIGTVILPLLSIFLRAAGSGLAGFIIGWGKPVPVNPYRLHNRRIDGTLVAMAGPFVNLVLGVLLVGGACLFARQEESRWMASAAGACGQMAVISFVLCFFNLLPIPPLDGSHLLKNALGMSEEAYMNLCRYGFIAVIIVVQLEPVQRVLGMAVEGSVRYSALLFGVRI